MSSLPRELDFSTASGRDASPERMNSAMDFIMGKFRALESLTPDVEAALNTLRALGLVRITEVLSPIFDDATSIRDALAALRDEWTAQLLPAQVRADVSADVVEQFTGYLDRYLGALPEAPATMPDGTAIPIGELYFDTTLNSMQVMGAEGWKSAGGIITTVMEPLSIVATAGQDTFPVVGGYDAGFLVLALNGMLLTPDEFTATDGANIVMAAPLLAGDVLSGYSFGAITLASVYNKTQSDARYRLVADSYAKADVDGIVAAKANSTDVYTKTAGDARYLKGAANLAELADAAAARGNLGLGSAAVRADTYFAQATNVFTQAQSDARYSLKADTLDLTTGDARYALKGDVYTKVQADAAYLAKADNLAALVDKAASRGNLGLGSAATQAASAFVQTGPSAAGIKIHSGTGAPSNALGADGDLYIG